LEFAWLISSL